MGDIAEDMKIRGFALVPAIVNTGEIAALIHLFETAEITRAKRGDETYGARNLLVLPEICRVAASPALTARLVPLLGSHHRAVRAIFFDKTESANWPVLWHQDLSLAVRERHDIPGWGGWSIKRGVQHVQAPSEVLARMVTARLHLDDCPAENGALRVIAGSHRGGRLSREAIQSVVAQSPADILTARAGDGLLMRPLILHASSPAQSPRHRRVLHLEFAPEDLLPEGLEWAEPENAALYAAAKGAA